MVTMAAETQVHCCGAVFSARMLRITKKKKKCRCFVVQCVVAKLVLQHSSYFEIMVLQHTSYFEFIGKLTPFHGSCDTQLLALLRIHVCIYITRCLLRNMVCYLSRALAHADLLPSAVALAGILMTKKKN